jgi:hypothetical protein
MGVRHTAQSRSITMAVGPTGASQGIATFIFGGPASPSGAVCTCGFSKSAGSLVQADADTLKAIFGQLHTQIACNESKMTGVELKIGPVQSGATFQSFGDYVGISSTNAVPPNTTFLIRKQVADISARFSGRMFWPGFAEGLVAAGGALLGSTVTAVNSEFNIAMNALDTAGLQPVVYSSLAGGQAMLTVDSFACQTLVGGGGAGPPPPAS